ncbi:hypothetical protein FBU31_002546 [Coemansia sp. 'formosensis']|uniref:Uncharacterized protein n=1 Tax=Coemansia furcata TaxID=417177 RepID=A0ACC1L2H7_9FUNG|nr:hypothetical protein H4S07_005506 [Coemansia furcata]KAJ2830155.1 hypothetical protein FBU31_002546 [Coemansia sp. 'formosensis']
MAIIGYISRTEHFSAAHRLHSPHLSDAENLETFGKCNHPGGHGHNYVLEVILRGPIDEKNGMVANIADVKRWIKDSVLDYVDHRNLDRDIAFFATRPSTTENLAAFVWMRLCQVMPEGLLNKVIVWETPKNKVIFTGEGVTAKDIEDCTV